MKKQLLFAFATLLLMVACSTDNNSTITISGITECNAYGERTGAVDETDWTGDTYLPDTVYPLFNFSDDVDYTNASVAVVQIAGYPNPVNSEFRLNFNVSCQTVVKFIIVDENLNVYLAQTLKLDVGSNTVAIQTDGLKSKYYRVYYAFYDSFKSIYFNGHGDILKN